MRFLHTADLHLGKLLHEADLLDDQACFLEQILSELELMEYQVLIIAGDVFDRPIPSAQALELWENFLYQLRLRSPETKVLIIPGNHDHAGRLSYGKNFFEDQGIYIQGDSSEPYRKVTIITEHEEVDFYLVPFLHPKSRNEKTETQDIFKSQRDLWLAMLNELKTDMRPNVPCVLVAHLFVTGGSSSDSERIFVGDVENVPSEWFSDWSYVALGHLHRPQEIKHNLWYSGSPLAYSFSEAGQEKKILRVELKEKKFAVTPIPLKSVHALARIKGKFDDLISNPSWDAYVDAWLEITLTDLVPVIRPMERLRERFPRLLSLHQETLKFSETGQTVCLQGLTGETQEDLESFFSHIGFTLNDKHKEKIKTTLRGLYEAP